jgi:hypothetical protein
MVALMGGVELQFVGLQILQRAWRKFLPRGSQAGSLAIAGMAWSFKEMLIKHSLER